VRTDAPGRAILVPSSHRAARISAIALLLGACANFSAITPGASVEQVVARVGTPDTVWKSPDGSETWEYPQGPSGTRTFMVGIGPDATVRDVRQVLSDAYFAQVHAGMTREAVRRLLGRPKEVWYFPARDEETWTYRYQELQGRYRLFSVLFDRTGGTVRYTLALDEIFGGRGR
jgi:hypothetical protein